MTVTSTCLFLVRGEEKTPKLRVCVPVIYVCPILFEKRLGSLNSSTPCRTSRDKMSTEIQFEFRSSTLINSKTIVVELVKITLDVESVLTTLGNILVLLVIRPCADDLVVRVHVSILDERNGAN